MRSYKDASKAAMAPHIAGALAVLDRIEQALERWISDQRAEKKKDDEPATH